MRRSRGLALVEIEELAVQAELSEVAAGPLDPAGGGDAPGLHPPNGPV